MDFGLLARKLGQYPAKAQSLFAKLRPHPVVAGGCGIALVEDQIDDRKDRRETLCKLIAVRNFERHALFAQRALGTHDALLNGRLRNEECPRDLAGRQTPKQAEREGDTRFGGECRMTGGEDKAEQIVANIVV